MSAKLAQRGVVGALIVATVGGALAAYFVSRHQLHTGRDARLDAASQRVAEELRRRTFYLEDVADMIGVHDDADVAEFSRYSHVRGTGANGDQAALAVQWVRRSPSGKLTPAGDVPPGTMIREPILVDPPGSADDGAANAVGQTTAQPAVTGASGRKQVGVSRPLRLAGGTPGFYIAVPVEAHRFSGDVSRVESRSAIVGLIDAQAMVEQAFGGDPPAGLRLSDGSAPLASVGADSEDSVSTTLPVPGGEWTVSVDGGSLSAFQRALPWLILAFGFALTAAVVRALRSAGERRDEAVGEAQRAHDELERARAEAERRSREDPLTGIFNRRHLSEVLDKELAGDATGTAVLLLDLDRFKRVNDGHGHLTGDTVLQVVAERIAAVLRKSDCLARWGGEEFAILAPGIGPEGASALAERTRSALTEDPIVVDGTSFELTLSVGVALVAPNLRTTESLVNAADKALYEAKRAGRNCVRVWDPDPSLAPAGSSD